MNFNKIIRERERGRERQRERGTERQRERGRERQRERDRQTQTDGYRHTSQIVCNLQISTVSVTSKETIYNTKNDSITI